jgi:hypothetical protein
MKLDITSRAAFEHVKFTAAIRQSILKTDKFHTSTGTVTILLLTIGKPNGEAQWTATRRLLQLRFTLVVRVIYILASYADDKLTAATEPVIISCTDYRRVCHRNRAVGT